MKYQILFLVITTLSSLSVNGQHVDPVFEFLDTHYKGGNRKFVKPVFRSLRYPSKVLDACIMAEVKARLYISPVGYLDSVVILNDVGEDLASTVTKALLKPKRDRWLTVDTVRTVDISTAFLIGDLGTNPEGIKGTFVVTAASNDRRCLTKEELLYGVNKSIRKKNYRRAQELCLHLLLRYPDESLYQQLYDKIVAEMRTVKD